MGGAVSWWQTWTECSWVGIPCPLLGPGALDVKLAPGWGREPLEAGVGWGRVGPGGGRLPLCPGQELGQELGVEGPTRLPSGEFS